jgi:titin
MRPIISRLVASLCLTVVLGSCNSDHAVAPDAGLLFFSGVSGAVPTMSSALPVSATRIDLAWADNATNESGFEIFRGFSFEGPFTLLVTTAPNVSSYSDLALASSTRYCYEVRAFRRNGRNTLESAFSAPMCAMTLPPSPFNVNAVPVSSTVVRVTWSVSTQFANGFRIEQAASSQGPWSLVASPPGTASEYLDVNRTAEVLVCYRISGVTPSGTSAPSEFDCTTPPAAPINLTATAPADRTIDLTWSDQSGVEDGYEVQRARDGQAFTVYASLPANAVNYHDVGVLSDVTYHYRVRATKDGGFSDFSNTASDVSASTRPNAPGNTKAMPLSSTVVRVTFEDGSLNEAGFRVERSTDGRQTWQTVSSLPAGDDEQLVDDGNRLAEQQVCYRVFAFNAKGDSDPSNVFCTAAPAAPTDLTAVTTAHQVIDLHWTNNSNVADGYIVQRVYAGYYYYDYEYYETIATLGATATSYHDLALNPNEYATYRVLALKDGGLSDPSNQASASSELAPPAPSGLTATASAGLIDVSWTFTGPVDYFSVERCRGTADSCTDASFTFLASVDGVYRVYTDRAGQSGNTFTYRVLAVRSGAASHPSNEATATFP